jgi:hypothetical protein
MSGDGIMRKTIETAIHIQNRTIFAFHDERLPPSPMRTQTGNHDPVVRVHPRLLEAYLWKSSLEMRILP